MPRRFNLLCPDETQPQRVREYLRACQRPVPVLPKVLSPQRVQACRPAPEPQQEQRVEQAVATPAAESWPAVAPQAQRPAFFRRR